MSWNLLCSTSMQNPLAHGLTALVSSGRCASAHVNVALFPSFVSSGFCYLLKLFCIFITFSPSLKKKPKQDERHKLGTPAWSEELNRAFSFTLRSHQTLTWTAGRNGFVPAASPRSRAEKFWLLRGKRGEKLDGVGGEWWAVVGVLIRGVWVERRPRGAPACLHSEFTWLSAAPVKSSNICCLSPGFRVWTQLLSWRFFRVFPFLIPLKPDCLIFCVSFFLVICSFYAGVLF